MSSFCKCKNYSHFFSKNISIYAIFNDQSFNDTLTNSLLRLSVQLHRVDTVQCKSIIVLFFFFLEGGGGWGGGAERVSVFFIPSLAESGYALPLQTV